MEACPSEQAVLGYIAGSSSDSSAAVREHLQGCDRCTELVAELIRTRRPLGSADAGVRGAPPLARASQVGRFIVLDVLGVVEKGAPKTTAATLAPRTPTWLSPDPPKTPLFYSSLVVAKF